jgi:hypothetical protein
MMGMPIVHALRTPPRASVTATRTGLARRHTPIFSTIFSICVTQRPELDRLLGFARDGDTVVVHKHGPAGAQPGRSAADCAGPDPARPAGEFVKEGLTFTGED